MLSSVCSLLLLALGLVSVRGGATGDLDYSKSQCAVVLGETDFHNGIVVSENNRNSADFVTSQADVIYIMSYSNDITSDTTTTTVQFRLDDNSGLYLNASGVVHIRLAIFEQTVYATYNYDPVQPESIFTLQAQTAEVVLTNPTAGIYNASIVNADGTFGTFAAEPATTYFLGLWFSAPLNIDFDELDTTSFRTNQTQYPYSRSGFPDEVSANLTGYGGYDTSTVGGNDARGPLALSYCEGPRLTSNGNGGGQVIGDPQFMGLLGQSYQVHGIDGAHYNIISSNTTQVNARFTYLSSGVCPPTANPTNCWSHPGSYLGAVGVMELVDGVRQQLRIEAGPARSGFRNVTLNGELLAVGSAASVGSLAVQYVDAYSVIVDTAQFTLSFDNSDMYLNQAVSARIPLARLTCHGLLGQTHHARKYNSAVKFIEGSVDDYSVADLSATDFPYNQFPASA